MCGCEFFIPLECQESTSTTNSVAETGASGFDLMFPKYSGDIIIESRLIR